MKIAVIVADATGQVHAGLDIERTVRLFEMPADMEQFIVSRSQGYTTITLSVVEEDKKDGT